MQKTITVFVLLLVFSTTGHSQNKLLQNNSILTERFNPLFVAAYKNPYPQLIPHTNNLHSYTMRPSKHELMYWPNYPLTAAQIETREREWERKNNQPFYQQIASDIIKSQVNSLIYGKKPVAVTPKF